MASPMRLTVFASGSGTNLQALIDACTSGAIPNARVIKVIVNRKTAFAATRAANAGIPSEYFNLVKDGFHAAGEKDAAKLKDARERYDAALAAKVLADPPDLIVLAGWMHIFTPAFLEPVAKAGVKVINLHPALPGKYDGAGAIARAYADFQAGTLEDNQTGVMVHFVIAEVDRGQPILVEKVSCHEGDTLGDLENRIHAVEHGLLVKATAKVLSELAATPKPGSGS